MSDKLFSDKLIERCTTIPLPNKVLFALGDSEEVRCASAWIKNLESEIKSLKAMIVEARPWVEIVRDEGFFLENSPPEKWLDKTKDIKVD